MRVTKDSYFYFLLSLVFFYLLAPFWQLLLEKHMSIAGDGSTWGYNLKWLCLCVCMLLTHLLMRSRPVPRSSVRPRSVMKNKYLRNAAARLMRMILFLDWAALCIAGAACAVFRVCYTTSLHAFCVNWWFIFTNWMEWGLIGLMCPMMIYMSIPYW